MTKRFLCFSTDKAILPSSAETSSLHLPLTPQITTGEAYLVRTKRLHSNSQFNQYLSALYKVVGTFLFGGAVSQSLTDLAKFTIGRPRPNFLSVCAPVSCNGYVLHINCTGNHRNVTESRWVYSTLHFPYLPYISILSSKA